MSSTSGNVLVVAEEQGRKVHQVTVQCLLGRSWMGQERDWMLLGSAQHSGLFNRLQ